MASMRQTNWHRRRLVHYDGSVHFDQGYIVYDLDDAYGGRGRAYGRGVVGVNDDGVDGVTDALVGVCGADVDVVSKEERGIVMT